MRLRRSVWMAALATTIVLALPAVAHATTRYVSTNGSDTNAGTLGSPYKTIQKAITVAVSGDVVHVDKGTYNGGVTMKPGVSLEATGAGSGNYYAELKDTTNSSAVVTATAIGANTHISGFKIDGETSGWGINCADSSLTIQDDLVTGNLIGIGCYGSSAPNIESCQIKDNTGTGIVCNASSGTIRGNNLYQNHGDSILCTAGATPSIDSNYIGSNWSGSRGVKCNASSPSIDGNDFGNNTVGVECLAGAEPTVTGNTFTGNNGPAAVSCNGSSPSIDNNDINSSLGRGIDCLNGSSATITNNDLNGNDKGIYCDASSPTISDDTIVGTGPTGSGDGISLHNGASPTITRSACTSSSENIWCQDSSATITDSTFADGWFGVDCSNSTLAITNCTISGNADGINCGSSSLTLMNDTVYGNQGGISCYNGSSASITNSIVWDPVAATELTGCSATYSDVLGGAAGTGNISADPSFIDATTGNFHLNADSPCISAATSTGAPAADKDGVPRPYGGGYDIGAYEYHILKCRLHYEAADAGGLIEGSTTQIVDFYSSGTPVTASPSAGHHFVEWSDHSTANPRTDATVTADATYTATFAINTYTLKYAAGTGGTIYGVTPQTVSYGESGSSVTASPDAGYRFVQWSDGKKDPSRQDTSVAADVNVTATFAMNTSVALSSRSNSSLGYGSTFTVSGTLKCGAPLAGL